MSNELPEQLSLMLPDDVPMDFRLLPAGEFLMGSRGYAPQEEPLHNIVITRPFYLGQFPVTQRQFGVWTQAAGVDHTNHFDGHPGHPAENMNWFQSRDFCQWLTGVCGTEIPVGYTAGLPSEAQWEYACRLMKRDGKPVAVETEYYTGDGEAALSQAGWFDEEWDKGSTHPVGSASKRPTDFGLHDMHGNVVEWCRDAWSADAYKLRIDGTEDPHVRATDVGESEEDADRVIRGGGWLYSAGDCRAAYRNGGAPVDRLWNQGFRVCLFFGPEQSQQSGTAVRSEPASGDGARRDAAAQSQDAGADVTEVDVSHETLPERSDGTRF